MKFRFSLLLVWLLSSYAAANAQSLPIDTLVFDWKIQQISDGSDSTFTGDANNAFSFKPDGSFELLIGSEVKEAGSWTLANDSITLLYELLPAGSTIDSTYYLVENGKAEIQLYYEGELVARQTDKGLESDRRTEHYAVSFDSRGNPTLVGNDRTFHLFGRATLIPETVGLIDIMRGFLGLLAMLAIAWIFSCNRKAIDWKLVGIGMGLQLLLAILVLKVPGVKEGFGFVADGFVALLGFTVAGAEFIFGGLVSNTESFGYIFAVQILPTVVFFSALTTMLYYLGVLQRIVYGFAWLMSKTMRLSGAESLAAAGNIFLGQTESPLLVRPYLDKMTRSEIMALMTGGMATIAGGVFAAYVGYLGGDDPVAQREFAKHLLTASIMSAPAALVVAKMLVPETEEVNKDLSVPKERTGTNLLDAISIGTTDGLKLAVNVGVMLLVFTALMEMFNVIVSSGIGEPTGLNAYVKESTQGRFTEFNLQYILGLIFGPIAWLLGVASEDMMLIGQLLGEKTIINEFVAYTSLGSVKSGGLLAHEKSVIIATYALCGFANFASIGIQIGGIGALAPSKRKMLSELGLRALLGGTLAAFLTAVIAGVIAFV